MLDGLRHIEVGRLRDQDLDPFLTIVLMPLTFSIANGVSFGVISYAAIKLLSGRGKRSIRCSISSRHCSSRATSGSGANPAPGNAGGRCSQFSRA